MTYIKICGLKNEEQALAAAEAGADFIGVVFTTSPRQVTPASAKKIAVAVKKNYPKVKTVGVFVNMAAARVKSFADKCDLDWVQLSGNEPWQYCLELELPLIKVVRVARNYSPEIIRENFTLGSKILAGQPYLFMLDTSAKDKYGGTGSAFDWNQAKVIAERFPVIVAGGLNPENVSAAIEMIKPWGVDVSSGVETRGLKDVKKIEQFIKAVRQADGKHTG
jgi:phosphoribosylanthranilate isomerase